MSSGLLDSLGSALDHGDGVRNGRGQGRRREMASCLLLFLPQLHPTTWVLWVHVCGPASSHVQALFPLPLGLVAQSVLRRMKPGGGHLQARAQAQKAQKHTHTEEGCGRPRKGALLLGPKASTAYRAAQTAAEHVTAN